MAGTITVSTLSDGTNSTSSTNCIQGSAKVWVNFDGTTSPATIKASYNVSSVTRNATGDYTVNFTNALVDGNSSVVALSKPSVSFTERMKLVSISSTNTNVANGQTDTNVLQNSTIVCVSVFR